MVCGLGNMSLSEKLKKTRETGERILKVSAARCALSRATQNLMDYIVNGDESKINHATENIQEALSSLMKE